MDYQFRTQGSALNRDLRQALNEDEDTFHTRRNEFNCLSPETLLLNPPFLINASTETQEQLPWDYIITRHTSDPQINVTCTGYISEMAALPNTLDDPNTYVMMTTIIPILDQLPDTRMPDFSPIIHEISKPQIWNLLQVLDRDTTLAKTLFNVEESYEDETFQKYLSQICLLGDYHIIEAIRHLIKQRDWSHDDLCEPPTTEQFGHYKSSSQPIVDINDSMNHQDNNVEIESSGPMKLNVAVSISNFADMVLNFSRHRDLINGTINTQFAK